MDNGFEDNEAAADKTIPPEDTAQDLDAQGRLDGYQHSFTDATALFSLRTTAELFDSSDLARTFIETQFGDFFFLVGQEIDQDPIVTLDAYQLNPFPPSVGDDARAGLLAVTVQTDGGPVEVVNNFLVWRSGRVVAGVQVVSFDGQERVEAVARLSLVMEQRIDQVFAMEIPVAPTPSPTPTPTPIPLLDLEAMAPTLEDIPGAVVHEEGIVEDPITLETYVREFRPPESEASFPLGSSQVGQVVARLEQYATAGEASEFPLALADISPDLFGDLLGQSLVEALGITAEDLVAASVDLPTLGDAAAGFQITVGAAEVRQDIFFVFSARGRVAPVLTVVGLAGEVAAADVVALAQLIDQRILEATP